MALADLLQDWDHDHGLIDQKLATCFQVIISPMLYIDLSFLSLACTVLNYHHPIA